MKSILFLAYDLPWPLDAGGKIRSYHLIRQLAKSYHVTLLYFNREKKNSSFENHVSPYCQNIISHPRRDLTSLQTLRYMGGMPYPAALYYDPHVETLIKNEIGNGIDLLHAESFYTSMYVSQKRNIPQILGTENIEWHVYQDFARQEKNLFIRPFYNFEIGRIKNYEIDSWQRADIIIAVSDENKKEIEKHTEKPVAVIRNGVDTDYFKQTKRNTTSNTLLFVGNFNYIQNIDAAEYLLKDIVPVLPDRFSIRLVGRDPSAELQKLAKVTAEQYHMHISVDAHVEDIRDAFDDALCLIAPLRTGSGTKFKILESLAGGLPVVTSSIGAEGLAVTNEKELLIAETPEEFAHQVQRLTDTTYHTMLSKNGQKVILKKYSWDVIGNKLRELYEKTLHHYR